MEAVINIGTKDLNILNYYKQRKEGASDVFKKNDYLEHATPKNGLAIHHYPSGTPLVIIEKVNKSLIGKETLNGFNSVRIKTTHGFVFHLVRNGSSDHILFEKRQQLTGGLHSEMIQDLGDFRIIEVKNWSNKGLDGGDYSLYKTSDDFTLQ